MQKKKEMVYYFEDASFLRIKDVSLSYDISKKNDSESRFRQVKGIRHGT